MSEPGELVIRQHNHDDDTWEVEIVRADVQVLIAADLLREAQTGGTHARYLIADEKTVTVSDDFGQRFVYRLDDTPRADAGFPGACRLMIREPDGRDAP